MKLHPPLLLLAMLLVSCLDREVIEIAKPDLSLATNWCSNGRMTYQFEEDGRFTMYDRNDTGWGGHWSFAPNALNVEIILRYGPDIRIQHILLSEIGYDATQLTAKWSDEMMCNVPVVWKRCNTLPNPKK